MRSLASPEAMGVESQGIRNWLEAVDAAKLELHGFVILRHGETVAEGWWDPYQPQSRTFSIHSPRASPPRRSALRSARDC